MKGVIAILFVVLCLGGCGGEPDAPMSGGVVADSALAADAAEAVNPFAEPARRAMRIELGLDGYRRVEGTWTAGDASSAFTAYVAGDTLRLIEERLSMGEYGDGTGVYYFDEGGLFYAVQDERRAQMGREAGGIDAVRLRVALGPGGAAVAVEQLVGGEPVPTPDVEIEGVRRHAAALAERAREAARPAL